MYFQLKIRVYDPVLPPCDCDLELNIDACTKKASPTKSWSPAGPALSGAWRLQMENFHVDASLIDNQS